VSPAQNRPTISLYLSVALISAAVLGYEVALTRVFSVLLRYQFAFMVISLALCGIGLGGLWAHHRRTSPQTAALFFGWSVAFTLLFILRAVFAVRPDQYWIAAVLVVIPFAAGGAFLSSVFSRYSEQGGKLYGWDLAGAALAAMGSVAVMQVCGAIDACLIFGALGSLAALVLAEKPNPVVVAIPLLLAALWPLNHLYLPLPSYAKGNWHTQADYLWSVQPIPPMLDKYGYSLADNGVTQPLFTELGDARSTSKIIDTRWNAFARTDVVIDPDSPNSFLLYTNGNVPTNMLHWDGEEWELPHMVAAFPISDWTFYTANIKGGDVMSIGPGGGLDSLLAIRYGARSFDGAEINPGIVQLMHEKKYTDFNGDPYSRPDIHVHVAEGRSFVREQIAKGKRYSLVFSALTKTATAGQGMALLESYIYTTDAFKDYLAALKPDGCFAIVGDAPGPEPLLLERLFLTAMTVLESQGMTPQQAGNCIAIAYDPRPGPYQWSMVVRKRPWTLKETFGPENMALTTGVTPLWIPNQAADNYNFNFDFVGLGQGGVSVATAVASARETPGFAMDLSPCPDDRPFVLDLSASPWTVFKSSLSLSILSLGSIAFTLLLAGLALRQGQGAAGAVSTVFYFLALGVGFMLVEIPLIQKLILPLGYPTLSLTVILFSLLLGGGLGATFSQRFEGLRLVRHAQVCASGVAVYVIGFAAVSNSLGGSCWARRFPPASASLLRGHTPRWNPSPKPRTRGRVRSYR